jgi:hypothetical protein
MQDKRMDKKSYAAIVAAFTLLIISAAACGCTDRETNSVPENLTVVTKNTCWSPAMSSIIGIDITPEYDCDYDCIFHWTATGDSSPKTELLLWGVETKGGITEKGNDTWTRQGITLWWTCREYEIEKMPEKFTLRIEAVESRNNTTLAETEVEITRKAMIYCVETG